MMKWVTLGRGYFCQSVKNPDCDYQAVGNEEYNKIIFSPYKNDSEIMDEKTPEEMNPDV